MNMNEVAGNLLIKVREQKPLVHNITNFVVMNYTANALLACGASPVMAHAKEEVEEMVQIANALVLNIGTLEPAWVQAMDLAAEKASRKGIPVVLDPVGAGATRYRTETAKGLLQKGYVSVVRGNSSEILALSDEKARTRGVDALHETEDAVGVAMEIARTYHTIVAVTGPVDLVTDGETILRIRNGHPLMGKVTGTGCTATAIIGAFCGVTTDYLVATASALAYFGAVGEVAARTVSTPGSYMIALLDTLYSLSPEDLIRQVKIDT